MTILGADHFNNNGRVLTNGWNGAADGQTWNVLTGGVSNFSVVSGQGKITGGTGAQRIALGSQTSVNCDVRCRVHVTSITDSVSVDGRITSSNTCYRARLLNNNLDIVLTNAGVLTVIATTPFTINTNKNYQLHLRTRGSTISASAWLDGSTEPTSFTLTTTNTGITAAGQCGVSTVLGTPTDVVLFDNYTATNPTQVVDNPYGITLGINANFPAIAPLYTTWAYLFSDMSNLGLSWLRFQINWDLIQRAQSDPTSAWSWGPLDDAVNRCNEAGLYISYPMRGAPTWALATTSQKASTEPWFIMDPTMAAAYATAVVTRYNGSNGHGVLNSFEIGNEEFNIHFSQSPTLGINNSPFSEYNGLSGVNSNAQPARDPHFFAPVLAAVSPAVSAVTSTIHIVSAAIWWNQYPNVLDFLQGVYNECTGAKNLFTQANVHYYSNARDPSLDGTGTHYLPSFQQSWNAMKTTMAANSDANKTIWVTEFGWGTNSNNGASIDCDPPTQATRYAYLMDNARTSGIVTKIFLFTLGYSTQDSSGNPTTGTASLVQWDVPSQSFIQLPAYATMQSFIAANPLWNGGGGSNSLSTSASAKFQVKSTLASIAQATFSVITLLAAATRLRVQAYTRSASTGYSTSSRQPINTVTTRGSE